MKLLTQPGDGVMPLVKAIRSAQSRVEILIFRFDRREIERALADAVSRGVFVHALVAYTNHGGEKNLRKLETRLLSAGVTVARTANDLMRYHGKMMIVDRRDLYLLGFNYTYLDIEHSRSFGLITSDGRFVQEAVKLFEADTKRQAYSPGLADFVVSPTNARKSLAAFIRGAERELLIYDPKIGDPMMIRLLEERAKAGVTIRIIGRLTRRSSLLEARRLPQVRLHTRTMLRDGRCGFIGSQSLRDVELDARREVGMIFDDPKVVGRLIKIFQADWALAEQPGVREGKENTEPAAKVAKKVARAVAKDFPRVTPALEVAVKEVMGKTEVSLNPDEVEETVQDAVKDAVKEAVRDVVEEVVEQKAL